ncbi:hypothetical protein MKK50_18380 [Methylobacterium sp. J-043]|nr:hypothetical protein [Methylobacterium sp. J-043]
MRVRIHRGMREIGGTCVELEHDGARLLLDLNLPLDGAPDDTSRHPAIDGLTGGGDLLALVLSYGHRDHVGVRQRQVMTRLAADGGFGLDPAAAFWTRYEGLATLAEMKRAATPLAGLEKTGVHALVQASPNVVDVEVSLTGAPLDIAAEPDGAQAEVDAVLQFPDADAGVAPTRQDRLDVASLEERGVADEAWLVFHEAKLATNPALRSRSTPAIVGQVERYRATLKHEADRLATSYPALCRDLVRLDTLRRTVRLARGLDVAALPLRDPLVAEVASGARRLRVDPEPRLVLFGFDADQRGVTVGTITESLRSQHGLRVYAVGRSGKGTAAFRRPKDLSSEAV